MTQNPRKYLTKLVATCERMLEKKRGDIIERAGSTGLFVLLYEEFVYSACVGDSRAVAVLRDGNVLALTRDQTPENKKEKARLEKIGTAIEQF